MAGPREREQDEFSRFWEADERGELRNARAGYLPASNGDQRGTRFVKRGQLRRTTADDGSGEPSVQDDDVDQPSAGRGAVNPPEVKQ